MTTYRVYYHLPVIGGGYKRTRRDVKAASRADALRAARAADRKGHFHAAEVIEAENDRCYRVHFQLPTVAGSLVPMVNVFRTDTAGEALEAAERENRRHGVFDEAWVEEVLG